MQSIIRFWIAQKQFHWSMNKRTGEISINSRKTGMNKASKYFWLMFESWVLPAYQERTLLSHHYYQQKLNEDHIHIWNYDNGTHAKEDLDVHVSHKLLSSEEAVQGSWMKTFASHRTSLGSCLCLVQLTSSASSLVSLLQVFTTPIPYSCNCQSNLSKTQIKQSCFSASTFSVITAWFSNFHGYRNLLEKLLYTYT